MGKCTVIARNAVFWVWPMGFAAWLAGLVFIPRAKSKVDRAKAVINDVVEQLVPTKVFILNKQYFYIFNLSRKAQPISDIIVERLMELISRLQGDSSHFGLIHIRPLLITGDQSFFARHPSIKPDIKLFLKY